MGRRRIQELATAPVQPAEDAERRERAEQTEQSNDAAVAAAVAALLIAGGASATVAPVAGALLLAVPAAGLAAPALAAEVAAEAAELVLTEPPTFDNTAGEYERRASLENILMRGFYGAAAVKRLSKAVVGPSGTSIPERLAKALRAERSYLTGHKNARARNLEGAQRTDAARELYGDFVTWNHGAKRQPAEPRPHHVAADGRVWNLRRGIPVSTGALPGVLPYCTCEWGPPRPGAPALI